MYIFWREEMKGVVVHVLEPYIDEIILIFGYGKIDEE